jgi:hypothetical protein
LEKPPFHTLVRFVRLREMMIDETRIDGDDVESSETDDFRSFVRTIRDIPPGGRVRVSASWTYIKSVDDSEVWRSRWPSDGMTLCVQFPPEAKVTGAHALHRQELTKRGPGAGHYYEWTITDAVLPHQGMVFYWRCSDPPSVTPPDVPGAAEPPDEKR